ncbi:LysR family transcriptional regulator [Rahnella ecdela]|uniref:LysR family transcriptional regulator n=1 Tax=Rahnella ecdela TaxID=2816250 RepID=A0ABS6L9E2_9GAMM|nr:LysR family transcriptional regulator [Rahnella ecdela]MBU9843558.1 LysR family transcriptional regulator [Rahnella ecdela]
MNSKDFDLNSLLILNAVIECQSVTAAAKKMALSPSSVTYAINKIRKVTLNPIFTRSKNGITPTTLALELDQRYIKAISLITDGLDLSVSSENPDVCRNITVSTYNFFELWFSQFVYQENKLLDGMCLNFVNHPVSNEKRIVKIRNHEVDLDIGGLLPNDPSIISHKLCSSKFKALVSINHPTIKDTLTLDDWNMSKHVKWAQISDETLVQEGDANQVEALLRRSVEIKSENSLNSLMICTMSDYITLVPEYLETFLLESLPVKIFDLPFETTMTSTIYAHHHRSEKRNEFISLCLEALAFMAPKSEEVELDIAES